MSRRLPLFLTLLLTGGGSLLWLGGLAGCSDTERRVATEMDDPEFRRAQELGKAGRSQEALVVFQKVIARRGEDAPESHLELGLLYLQHIKDPIPAIYHFNEYVRLRPNSPQAPFVRQRIDAARREFARTLPAQPLENQFERLDLMAALDRLKQENAALKEEIVALRAGRAEEVVTVRPGRPAPAPTSPVPPPTGGAEAASPAPVFRIGSVGQATPVVRARPSGTGRQAAAPVVASPQRESPPPTVSLPSTRSSAAAPVVNPPATRKASPPPKAEAPAQKTGRTHTVGSGDTLMGLAQRYYGTRSRWKEIREANKDQLPADTSPLKIGMKLKIP
jgi:nucleoid-associated protein YgaU